MTGSMLRMKHKIMFNLLQLWLNPCVFILSFTKSATKRSFGPAARDSKLFKTHSLYGGTKNLRRDRVLKKNYKMTFFFFILVYGEQTEPHAASQETPWSWWERELSDYCFGQWLASVWGRGGKKRERVSERVSERGTGGVRGWREGRRERGREEAAAAVWKSRKGGKKREKKKKKLLGALFTGRTLGLEETRGSRASHQLPHMSFTHSFKQYSAPPDCIREARQWNGRPRQPVRPVHWSAGAVLMHPWGLRFTPTPSSPARSLSFSMFLLCFFPPQAIFFSPHLLLRRLSRVRWIFVFLRGIVRGVNKGSGH